MEEEKVEKKVEKSPNFSLTWSLLSLYMKENGSFGAGLPLEMPKGVAASNKEEITKSASNSKDPEKAQLTIFYSGKVLVFDNFPGDKVKDLMEMASNGKLLAQSFNAGAPPLMPRTTSSYHKLPLQANASDMPIARRNSLHRFLEKRKDRVGSKAPYQVINGSSSMKNGAGKQGDNKLWLGLGREASGTN
ncbi:protein TIFY 10b-like isoform X1 [Typha angustifolia]|uniref:protein TIFY 10b-like isoform X1 n=1 Tax=Typha angustifolia TaxID=59011 RepID=UPI003C2EDD20